MSSHGPQIRNKPGSEEVYCPGRDVVNIFPSMLKQLVIRYNRRHWPTVFEDVAKKMGVSENDGNEELIKANDAFMSFLMECCRDSNEKYGDVMSRVGWEAVHPAAQAAYMMMLGTLTAGMMFASLRDVSMEGDVPPSKIKPLEHSLDEARRLANGVLEEEEAARELQHAIRASRAAGLSYDNIQAIVTDVKLGRV